ncbi:MAG: hypothetical protein DRQ45_00045 [Gammaproteobacteria bacterium]|nr:MAG: hypothetical protein DRQ45_00045 [Gammaproteobacteria bacterium]
MILSLLRNTVLLAVSISSTVSWATGNNPGNALRVNGVDISNQRYIGFYLEYQRSKNVAVGARGDQLPLLTKLRKEAMELLIEQEVLLQAAEAEDIEVLPGEVDAAFTEVSAPFNSPVAFRHRIESEGFTEDSYRIHLRRMIAAAKYLDGIRAEAMNVSDEELEAYYRDNEVRLTLPEQVRVRHILLSWKPLGKPDDRAALHEQMVPILKKARDGEDFAELARQYSEDSTRMDGGDVGLFNRGMMVPAFEAMAFSLQPGEISDIIETPFGVHILRLEERRESRLLPLDEVREQLRDHIRKEKMDTVVDAKKVSLREQAEVQVLIPMERPKKN